MLFRRSLEKLQAAHTGRPFEILFWNGERWRFGSTSELPSFVLKFKTRTALVRAMLQSTLGLGESYISGDLTVEGNLEDALTTLFEHGMRQPSKSTLSDWAGRALTRTLSQQRADVERHYGRSPEFYSLYLGKKLQYSAGYFRTAEDSLDQAQEQKLSRLTKKLDLRRGQRLLDIGCGWGHLMFHAAEKYGVECLGITLSDNQTSYIREQARVRKLPVKVRTMNYLELDDCAKWDRIVSVGMMCHLGESRADSFFDQLSRLASPKAIVVTNGLLKMKESSSSDPFVEKHILPGYCLFSLEGATRRAVDRGFNVIDTENHRRHCAMTAQHWRKNFLANRDAIKRMLRCDDRFLRMWDFYLASLVGGLRAGHLNVIETTMSHGITDDYPLTPRDSLTATDRLRPVVSVPTISLRSRTTAPS